MHEMRQIDVNIRFDLLEDGETEEKFSWSGAQYVPVVGNYVLGRTGVEYRVRKIVWTDPEHIVAAIERENTSHFF